MCGVPSNYEDKEKEEKTIPIGEHFSEEEKEEYKNKKGEKKLKDSVIPMATETLKKLTPKLDWKDISHEIYRTYTFVIEGHRVDITIRNPVKLNVSKSGGHRILDAKNVSHYIPFKWIHLASLGN